MTFIAWFTLRPSPEDISRVARTDFLCFYPCGEQELRDAVLNIALFLPLGLGLGRLLPAWAAFLLCVAGTCGIEYAQWGWLAGRDASLRDLVTNAAGGGLGVWLAHGWRAVLLPPPPLAGRLGFGAGLMWLALVGLTALGVQPSLPDTAWWGQWAPQLEQFEQWRGTLLDANLNGAPIPPGEAANTAELRQALASNQAIMAARILTGPQPAELAPIVSIFDGEQREIVVLGQRGPDLIFRIRTRMFASGLRGPLVRFPDALTLPPGEAVTVSGGIVDRGWQLKVTTATTTRSWNARWSAGLLWTGFLPFTYLIAPEAPLFNALWLGIMLLPAGYWLGRTPDVRRAVIALVLIVGLGLGVLAPLAGLSPSPALEWLGSLAGGAVGLLSGAATGLRQPAADPAASLAASTTR